MLNGRGHQLSHDHIISIEQLKTTNSILHFSNMSSNETNKQEAQGGWMSGITNTVSGAAGTVGSTVGGAVGTAGGAVGSVGRGLGDTIGYASSGLENTAKGAQDTVEGATGAKSTQQAPVKK